MYYDYQDFNKKDKKLIQSLVEVSAKNEIKNFMLKMLPDHQGLIEKEHEDIRKPYWEFFDSFKDFSKHLTHRYDGYRHSDLPLILTHSRVEGNLTDVHFADFSEDGKVKFEELLVIEKKRRNEVF